MQIFRVISSSFFYYYFSFINSFIFSINLFPKNFAWLLVDGGGTCGLVLICLKGDGWMGIERCLKYKSDEFDDLWLKSANADI